MGIELYSRQAHLLVAEFLHLLNQRRLLMNHFFELFVLLDRSVLLHAFALRGFLPLGHIERSLAFGLTRRQVLLQDIDFSSKQDHFLLLSNVKMPSCPWSSRSLC